ncbi:MAG TPA: zinc ribbon domain-containing protein [Pyrinomonadaceae bacterium]|jgi:hypothetical protein
MFCPQCGIEAASEQRYCRSCGANLKIVARAVSLGDSIAMSDRHPLSKIKEMMKELRIDQATDEVSRSLEKMNQEIVSGIRRAKDKKRASPESRRNQHIAEGAASLGAGIGMMIALYYFSATLASIIPPETLARIPFALEPVLRAAWVFGLIPAMAGTGRLTAGLLMRVNSARSINAPDQAQPAMTEEPAPRTLPNSVTDHTTEILDKDIQHAARRD